VIGDASDISRVLRDPLAEARAAKLLGTPVVGFLSNNVPVEMIHAAGAFALQLPTAPGPTPLADRYLEAPFDPQARAALEQLLRGALRLVDLLVLPRAVDSFQRLYYYACELKRSAGAALPELHLYDVLHTPWQTSADYNLARTEEFARRLSVLTGRRLDDAALSASIAHYNRLRDKLARLSERRRAAPAQLSGVHALEVFSASQRMTPERFERALDALLAQPSEPASGTRTVLFGSAHDTPALHQLVAHAGGQVVADYHWRGELLFGPAIDRQAPPLQALSTHYHRHSQSQRSFLPQTAAIVECASRARAEAALFFHYAEEEALTWDYPVHSRALRDAGLPVLHLTSQSYPPLPSIQPTLEAFFASSSARRSA
jgi:benzoyl-CoA reductase/2-hydroxyglutaryl-CoA dehydratase subunit BcrC/BadD/HgdB